MTGRYRGVLYEAEGGLWVCKAEPPYMRHCPECGAALTRDIALEDQGFLFWACYHALQEHQMKGLNEKIQEFELIGIKYLMLPSEVHDDGINLYSEKDTYWDRIVPWRAQQMLKIAELLKARQVVVEVEAV